MRKRIFLGVLALTAAAWAQTPSKTASTAAKTTPAVKAPAAAAAAPAPTPDREPGLYATFNTSMGVIVCRLFEKEAPLTVANFSALARGAKEWTHPRTGVKMKTPLYNGTVFHRVIPGFMIQGGDPVGTGMGDPGYKFKDEFGSGLKFDQPGRLAMANSGPNTNGSQFFITEVPTPHLNNLHTIFGQVIEGADLVPKITNVPRDGNNKPRTPIVVKSVRIQRFPLAAAPAAPAKKSGVPATKAPVTKKAAPAAPATKTTPKI